MASIFGRRQKPASNKKGNQPANGSQNGVDALMSSIIENGTKGVNGESDYHKNGRQNSSTFKPQIPPTSSINSSSPAHTKDMNNHSNVNKRYIIFIQGTNLVLLIFLTTLHLSC